MPFSASPLAAVAPLPSVSPAAGIDLLRGLASVWVVLYHLNCIHPPLRDAYHRIAAEGWLGVWIFFVVSGYCIAASAAKGTSWSQFAWRRFWRIFPPYWGSLILVLAVVGGHLAVQHVNDVTPLPRGWGAAALTLLALVRPASAVDGINWVYWSLPLELGFYLIMGVAVALGRFRPGFLLLISLGAWGASSAQPGVLFFPAWLVFSLGAAVYYLVSGERAYSGALGLVAILGLSGPSLATDKIVTGLAGAGLILLFHFVALPSFPVQSLRRLGAISYSLYLTHVPVGCYVLAYSFDRFFPRRGFAPFARDGLLLAGCVVFATGFYRWVEGPSHAVGRSGWKGRAA